MLPGALEAPLGPIGALAVPALPAVHIGRLPEPALRRVLLGSSDNLLRHVSVRARVCREWRRIVGTSAAYSYGRDRAGWIERRRVLRAVAQTLDAPSVPHQVLRRWGASARPSSSALRALA